MRAATLETVVLGERRVEFRRVRSRSARRLRVRVGPAGVEVIQPPHRSADEVALFLCANRDWLLAELARTDRLKALRRGAAQGGGFLRFRGEETPVRVLCVPARRGANTVKLDHGIIVVRQGAKGAAPARSLENWLRREARTDIRRALAEMMARLRRAPRKIYVMGQRTKWGNCSARRNLSFNWRLVLAPPRVLHYLVAHEAAHLAVPDHSHRFWLLVQSLSPGCERARQWLVRHHAEVFVDLAAVCAGGAVASGARVRHP